MSKAAELANLIGNINAGGGGVNRNLIINGAMEVAQRGTSFSNVTSSQFCLDRFSVDVSGGGALTYSCTAGAVNGNDDHPYCSALTANRAYVTQTTSSFPFRSGYSGHNAASSSGDYADFFDPNGAILVAHGDLA